MRIDFRNIMDDLTQDLDAVLSEDAKERALDIALSRYSEDKPLMLIEDFTASASGSRIDPPSGYLPGTSRVLSMEYPIDEQPPALIGVSEYQSPLATYLDLDADVTLGESLRATYTGLHVLTTVSDTIPVDHRQAVAFYAASLTCRQLSALYAHDGSSTIAADAVDHQTKSDRFRSLANKYEAEYFDTLGIPKQRQKPACAIADLDLTLVGGGDRLYHTRRTR